MGWLAGDDAGSHADYVRARHLGRRWWDGWLMYVVPLGRIVLVIRSMYGGMVSMVSTVVNYHVATNCLIIIIFSYAILINIDYIVIFLYSRSTSTLLWNVYYLIIIVKCYAQYKQAYHSEFTCTLSSTRDTVKYHYCDGIHRKGHCKNLTRRPAWKADYLKVGMRGSGKFPENDRCIACFLWEKTMSMRKMMMLRLVVYPMVTRYRCPRAVRYCRLTVCPLFLRPRCKTMFFFCCLFFDDFFDFEICDEGRVVVKPWGFKQRLYPILRLVLHCLIRDLQGSCLGVQLQISLDCSEVQLEGLQQCCRQLISI